MHHRQDLFISYSQNKEDVLLWRALRMLPRGFYVDIGAQHPVNDSVTKAFYDRGWKGINVEPNPACFPELQDQRPRDINLNLAVSNLASPQRFWCVEQTGLSTLDSTLANSYYEQGYNVRGMEIEVRPLSRILLEHADHTIHFLKIDVEGHERAVLESCDFEKFRPWIVVVEATVPGSSLPQHQYWEGLLTQSNYSCVHFDGLNRYYLAQEHADLTPHFSYPPCVFDQYRPHREWELEMACDAHIETISHLQSQLSLMERDRAAQARDIIRLSELLEESEKDRAARLVNIQQLSAQLKDSEGDRAARLENIQQLSAQLEASESDRAARLVNIQQLSAQLEESESDRAARLENMRRLSLLLEQAEKEKASAIAQIRELESRLRDVGETSAKSD